jgi:adenylosuccinate synthase
VEAIVVVDLGFGDAGKGLLTDYLVRTRGAALVVRYNGGAQAGHNVVAPDGRHHTFSQFGAGTFVDGVDTVLSRHVVIHPTGLLAEAAVLEGKGIRDPLSRIRISERALVATPFHQAANRLREIARGAGRHGSCGVGVGEAVEDARARPDEAIRAADLRYPRRLAAKLARLRDAKWAEIEPLASSSASDPRARRERGIFTEEGVADAWIAEATRLGRPGVLVPDDALAKSMGAAATVVFEGAQGVLLDEVHGFHPFTTWSCCTMRNARELIREAAPEARVEHLGVLRSHAVRHGAGPLPTETTAFREMVSDHNRDGEWQGPVRYGWFDAVLARYALEVVGGVDSVALTHADLPARVGAWRVCGDYHPTAAVSAAGDRTGILNGAIPSLEDCEPAEGSAVAAVERLLGRSVDVIARGPTANDVARG